MKTSHYLDFSPKLGERVFIADGAKVIGRAELGDHVSIWFNSVVRADVNSIVIGKNTNVQDLCMFHVTEFNALTIGENTSFGHSVVLHGCKIGNGCLIGMGAIILDGAEIGDNCLVAAGSLVSPGKKFPPGSLIKGRPAVVERPLNPDEIQKISHHFEAYLNYKEQYLGMEESPEKKKGLKGSLEFFYQSVKQHNLFLLASSFAYYATLSLAPLLLILMGLGSLLEEHIQTSMIKQISLILPGLGDILQLIFKNLKNRVDLGTVSGYLGLVFLIFLSSILFKHLRHAFDVIYGDFNPIRKRSFLQILKERGWVMLIAFIMCSLFILSLLIGPFLQYIAPYLFVSFAVKKVLQVTLSFIVLTILFTGLYLFTPTRRNPFSHCFKMALVTSLSFVFGNYLAGLYIRKIALQSLYGAAGGILVFLLWAFYSSLMVFFTVELFQMWRKKKGA